MSISTTYIRTLSSSSASKSAICGYFVDPTSCETKSMVA